MKSLANIPVAQLVLEKPWPKLHVLSDVHLDTGPYELPADLEFDILIAAGDIGPVERAVPWLAAIGKPVIYVLGNHERYHTDLDGAVAQAKQLAEGTHVHVLERETIEIDGIRFLGATLWTNFGELSKELIARCHWRMNDYRYIQAQRYAEGPLRKRVEGICRHVKCAPPEPGKFHPAIAYLEHKVALSWFKEQLSRPYAGPTVIVTHHAPTYGSLRAAGISWDTLDPENWGTRNDNLLYVGNYASDLTSLLETYRDHIELWCHGHLHVHMDFIDVGVRVLCNPRGYYQKLLTKNDGSWLGASPSDEEVARSKEAYARDPYRGNGYGFVPDLVVDLADGFARPLHRAVPDDLVEMCGLYHQAQRIAAHLSLDDTVPAECMRIVFSDLCKKFTEVSDRVLYKHAIHLDHRIGEAPPFLQTMSAPPKSYRAVATRLRPLDLERDYLSQLVYMNEWVQWTKALRFAAKAALLEWHAMVNQMLDALDAIGISAVAQPPHRAALRYTDRIDSIVLFINHTKDVKRAEEELLRILGDQTQQCLYTLWVRGIDHLVDKKDLEALRQARAMESAIRQRNDSI